MVVDKVVCQRWCVKKLCVKDGVSKLVGDKVVCERGCVKEGGCHQAPRLPRKEPRRPRRHLGTKRATRASTPATQSDGRCRQVPRLPRKVKVDVAKCHACHAKSRGAQGVIWEPKGTRASPVP